MCTGHPPLPFPLLQKSVRFPGEGVSGANERLPARHGVGPHARVPWAWSAARVNRNRDPSPEEGVVSRKQLYGSAQQRTCSVSHMHWSSPLSQGKAPAAACTPRSCCGGRCSPPGVGRADWPPWRGGGQIYLWISEGHFRSQKTWKKFLCFPGKHVLFISKVQEVWFFRKWILMPVQIPLCVGWRNQPLRALKCVQAVDRVGMS